MSFSFWHYSASWFEEPLCSKHVSTRLGVSQSDQDRLEMTRSAAVAIFSCLGQSSYASPEDNGLVAPGLARLERTD